uniref:Carboxylesterase type B domain-containing protein n=1 Tax=Clastoptera arizonana TaxID=38151 RepID=A0A1B6CDF1_9HEMI
MSGIGLCPWAIHPPGTYLKLTQRIAEDFGCPINTTKVMVDCLSQVDPYELTSVLARYELFDLDPALLFPPIVEKNAPGAFLVQDPWTAAPTIPWISGIVSEEGSLRVGSLLRSEGLKERMARLNSDYKELLPMSIMVDQTAKDPVDIVQRARKFYFGNDDIDINQIQQIINMYSDAWFNYPSAESVLRHAGKVYYYYFSYKGQRSVAFQFGDNTDKLGVIHGNILIYFFPLDALFPNRVDTAEELALSHQLIDWWTNFANYRNPTPDTSSPITWEPVSTSAREYMSINNTGYIMDKNLLKERYEFWRSLPFREKPEPVTIRKN